MQNDIISVIVPVYNVEKYLATCLESIVNQTYPYLEIIVINDGSTDSSQEIIHQYAYKDSRIKLISQQNNGLSAARNSGMAAATGTYIVFVDSDDYIEKHMLAQMLSRLESTGADIVECGYNETFTQESPIRYVPYRRNYDEIVGIDCILESHIKGNISLLVWNKLYKREKVQDIQFAVGEKYEDILWSAEVLMSAQKICSIKEPLYYWRQRPNSITSSKSTLDRLSAVEHFDARIKMLESYSHVHLLARSRIICECYLEYAALKATKDAALIKIGKQHSLKYYHKHKLSFTESVQLGSSREIIRYYFYLWKFWYQILSLSNS